jgi:glycosyltransferase involved in cell wall biosynthesis
LLAAGVGGGSVTVIPHGAPLLRSATPEGIEHLRARYGLTGRMVLALGFIHPDKGSDVLVDAARTLLPANPDVTLVIAGEPRVRRGVFRVFGRVDARHLEQLRAAAGWAGARVVFPGFVADEDLADLLAAATVMALPYRRITQSGIAHLCVAGSVPAVASRLDGLEATLGDGAVYVPAGDAAALAAALVAVLDDDDGREAQRDRLAERRDLWTPAAVADRIVAVALDEPVGESDVSPVTRF